MTFTKGIFLDLVKDEDSIMDAMDSMGIEHLPLHSKKFIVIYIIRNNLGYGKILLKLMQSDNEIRMLIQLGNKLFDDGNINEYMKLMSYSTCNSPIHTTPYGSSVECVYF